MNDLAPSEKQRALALLKQMQARLDIAERRAREPVAVIGLGCRLPGGVEGAEAFWDQLAAGVDAVREVPPERWDAAAYYDADPDAPGKANTRWGGFLSDIDLFDAEFFGVSPREAVSMDPQQRLILETAWRALEHAGIPPLGLAGSKTGVFLGVCTSDYARLGEASGGCGALDTYSGTGGACGVAAGRLSYTLGLNGPSLVVDTACSSSLVAVHLAVQALRLGECDAALAGGVNLTLSPDGVVTLSKLRMMAPDGRCKPFDAAANGFVRGEGCGVVALKRLADARAAEDRVLAVIRGSAVNQDGRSSGLTAPSGLAQEAVIRAALANAGRAPSEVCCVETHGTGTPLGDPIEMNALAAVMGEGRTTPLIVGSVKSNLGHLEAAAGVTGLIKAVGMVRRGVAPPTLHFKKLNPDIDANGCPIRVAAGGMTALTDARRVVGVSSFGFSGTNAHIVLEADDAVPPARIGTGDGLAVLALSARSAAALARLVQDTVAAPALDDWPASAAALAIGRSALEYRIAVVAADAGEARRRLATAPLPDEPVATSGGEPWNEPWSGGSDGDRREVLEALARAFVAGATVDWRAVFPGARRFVDGLPGHPFLRKRYWRDGAVAQAGGHPLLTDRIDMPDGAVAFRVRLPVAGAAYLTQHSVGGAVIMPAAALLELAAGAFARCGFGAAVADVAFEAPLVLSGKTEILVSLNGDRLTIAARDLPTGPWTRCLSARAADNADDLEIFDAAAGATALVDVPALYQWLAAGGVAHGPTFRRVTEARQGPGLAWVRLDGLESAGHAVHPAALDAAFQSLAAMTWRADGERDGGAMRTPAAVRRFVLTGVGKPDGALTAHARLTEDGGADWVADIVALDSDGVCVAVAEGLRLSGGGGRALGDWRDWLLACDWPDTPLPADAAAMAAAAQASLSTAMEEPQIQALAGLGERMDAAAAAYAAEALRQVPAAALLPRHRALSDLLRNMADAAPKADASALMSALVVDYPDAATEIALLRRCGEGLAGALSGSLDPLTLLFPADGGAEGNVYRDSPASSGLNRALLAAVLAGLPTGGAIRLLEVGAGTGGTTDGLMAALPGERMAEYAVTDIAPTLLAAAKDRYADKPWATTARFDLERDPEEQGLQPGHYHMIVAANVVHATRGLADTLARLRRLLAPGGALVLLEGRGRQGWVDLCFGLTEGWWLFADHGLRPDHPMPDAGGWRAVLAEAGFDVEAATMDSGPFARQLVLTARRRAEDAVHIVGAGLVARALAERLHPAVSADDADVLLFAEALDSTPEPTSAAEVLERQRLLLDGARRLALAAAGRGQTLVLLTQDATTGARPLNAPLWGLGRAIAAELPEVSITQIDIAATLMEREPEAVAEAVVDLLRRSDGEDQIRLDADGRRRVARLRHVVPQAADEKRAARVDGESRYLVTGGFGGLGLRTALWLAEQGARKLVLMGRTAANADAETRIAALEADGVTVWRVLGDVSVEADVRAALATGAGRLAGVVHAAGTLDDGLLASLGWPRMATVLGPKLVGAWLLDRLAGSLDFLLLYSSAVGLIGTRGQGNHIAANAYLDALAACRTARGAWTVSLAWGAWSEIGSASGPDIASRLRAQGMDVIPPDQGVKALDWALAGAPTAGGPLDGRVGVLPIRLSAFAAALKGKRAPVLTDLLAKLPRPMAAKTPGSPRVVVSTVSLLDQVRGEAAAVLAAERADAIDPRRNLFDLGLDSLMAVELRNRLQNRLGAALPPTLLFDYPSCDRLTAYLADSFAPPPPQSAPSQSPSPKSVAVAAPAVVGESRDDADAVAIIGMDCRFPGGADGPDAFWRLLLSGFDAVGEFPADRWEKNAATERMTTRWGAFLDHVDQFDAAFFHIAPREAASMDPQQRLWLETAWRALEAAGQPPDRLAGSPTGVFVGLCNYDYSQISASGGRIDAWSGTGGAPSIVAGRLAYLLGLEGPALVVDTACSSSLVAVHLACRGLIDGDCRLAVAGGVNLILAPSSTIALSELQMMAPDGRCKAFDAAADGFVRGEGCGVVVLKRLSDARADGDPVLAVIRGSFINQDGRSSSLTAPSGRAQEAALRGALARARMTPERIGYIETHGTGTALGDPIEIHALKAVFGPGRDAAQPLAVGAVKTNLGHLEAAAGVAGLIKAVLALRHGVIPPNNHLKNLNPHIELGSFPALLPVEPTPWPAIAGPRAAGVSAFGFSGTNVHLTLEQAPEGAPVAVEEPRALHLIVASGATPTAARRRAVDFADLLTTEGGPSLGDLAHTSLAGRAHLDFRVAAVAVSGQEAARALRNAQPPEAGLQRPRVGWVFTGQGAQRAGMGRELYRTEPVFRATIDRMAVAMAGSLDRPLTDILWGEASARIQRTGYAQPALFAVGFALAELYRHWGLKPTAVLGHSVGEYIAAAVAEAADADDIARLIAKRGALMQALPPGGAMAAVLASADVVRTAIGDDEALVSVAALNGPANTVISGDGAALDRALSRLDAAGVVARRLTVSHAFHSPLLEPMLDGLERAADAVAWRAPRFPLFGNLTGGAVDRFDGAYWRRHARAPVLFADGVRGMADLGCDVFLELGPQPILCGMGRRAMANARWLSSLDGSDMESAAVLGSLSALFVAGADIDGKAVSGGRGQRIVSTPTYPYERRRYWVDAAPMVASAPVGIGGSDLLGPPLRGPGRVRRFQTMLSTTAQPWLADHRVRGQATVPAAAMALTLAAAAEGKPLVDLRFHALLAVDAAKLAQTERDGDGLTLHAASVESDDWRLIAEACVGDASSVGAQDLGALRARCPQGADIGAFYASFPPQGIDYGPAFRPIVELHIGSGEALARLVAPAGLTGDALRVALLDGAFQSLGAAADGLEADDDGYLPVGLAGFRPFPAEIGAELWVWSRLARAEDGTLSGDVTVLNGVGVPLAEAVGLILRPNPKSLMRVGAATEARVKAGVFGFSWSPAVEDRVLPTTVHVAGADAALAAALAGRLAVVGGALVDADAAELVLFFPPDDDTLTACAALHRLAVHLIGRDKPPRLIVVTQGAAVLPDDVHAPPIAAAALWGVVATLRIEHPELDAGVFDMPPELTKVEAAGPLLRALAGRETFIALRNDAVFARALTLQAWAGGWGEAGGRAGLERPASGQLGDLAFQPLDRRPPGPGEVRIAVTAAGLNFRDVMNALGTYPGDGGRLGGECAGFVAALGDGVSGLAIGQPVMALAPGCLATEVIAKAALTLLIPAGWSHEQAATMPTVFLTAAHALRGPGRLRAGERVLIHAGTGGLGMAAIQIAQAMGAEVLATAGNAEKRAYLRGLGVSCVADSRSPSFKDEVLSYTGGQGVDVVLNALSGAMIAAGFDVLAPGGRFLEVGKAGVWSTEQAMAYRDDVAYSTIALDRDIVAEPEQIGRLWRGLMEEFVSGSLRSLPVTPFPLRDPEPAFRHMQTAKHMGRIALTRRTLRADATYLITGGTGALGRALARRLAADGAGSVTLAARREPDPALIAEMAGLADWGCAVRSVVLDVSDAAAVASWLAGLDRPLAGVFHAAGALDDGVFTQMTPTRFETALKAKLQGALVLDRLTRDQPLDCFVLFSSAAGTLGSAGQANYAAANAGLDALARRRRAEGLSAIAVAWGAWAGDGMAANRHGAALPTETALAALDDLLAAGTTQAVVLPVVDGEAPPDAAPPTTASLRTRLSEVEPAERLPLLRDAVRGHAAAILALAGASLDGRKPLNDYGLDSLMAVELRNALAAAIGFPLPASLIYDYPGIDALASFLAERLTDDGPDQAPPPEMPMAPPGPSELDAMSEEDLARALMEEMDRAGY
jgi:acyl transferase domain-containing protein/acyl carrier protein